MLINSPVNLPKLVVNHSRPRQFILLGKFQLGVRKIAANAILNFYAILRRFRGSIVCNGRNNDGDKFGNDQLIESFQVVYSV